jgi:hypothetical protein
MAMMSSDSGHPGLPPRVVLGALIIKHLEKLDDRGVIQAIQENIYMQYFVGLKEFKVDPVFDPSLFVEIRKRVGHKQFDSLSADLIRTVKCKKVGSQIEFGAKLGVSLDDGFARINTFSWDAYHEAGDLIKQVEEYRALHSHYTELVQVDKIYATQENRRWLKERGIRITASPLVRRPVKEKQSYYQKSKARKEAAERNHIEGKFGQGKNGYGLNQIRARLKETSESWVACIFFVMNLIHLEANHFFVTFFRWIAMLADGRLFDAIRVVSLYHIGIKDQGRNHRWAKCLT